MGDANRVKRAELEQAVALAAQFWALASSTAREAEAKAERARVRLCERIEELNVFLAGKESP